MMWEASSVFTQSPENSRRSQWNNRYVITSSDDDDDDSDDEHPNTDEIDDQEWEINGILDESESQYLLDWVGNWSPTWEPKEYASDLAIQVWEDKRKKEQFASQRNGASVGTSQAQSHVSISDDPRSETPEQESGVQSPPESHHSISDQPSAGSLEQETRLTDSPLFVPLDAVAESHFQEINEPPPLSLDTGNHIQSRDDIKPSKKQHQQKVFEYYPRAPIPPEYRLPGEFQEPFGAITQATDPTRTESTQNNRNLDLVSTASQDIALHPLISTAVVQPSPRREIPETPSILTSSHLSQVSRLGPSPGASGFLQPTGSIEPPPSTPVPKQGAVNASHTLTPRSGDPFIMDEPDQKKEGFSLAETMEKYSHIEGSTPREKIRNAYARLREKSTIDSLQNEPSATPFLVQNIQRSVPLSVPETVAPLSVRVDKEPSTQATPSSIEDIQASIPTTIPETVAPLSVRVDKEPSHQASLAKGPVPEPPVDGVEVDSHDNQSVQTIQPSALTISYTEQASPGSVLLGASEFAVPLPMDSRVKDDYERVLQDVWEFISDDKSQQTPDSAQEQVVFSMQQVLERLSNAATHPDINVAQHMKNAESDLTQEAAWADYSSAKFLLLNYLIKAGGDHDLHLILTVRGEKTQSIVERYLQGKGLSYSRPREEMGLGTNLEVSMVKGSLSFGIRMVAHSDGIVETYRPPSALIAFDSSLNTNNPSIEHMRTTYARNGHLLPVIRLMVANSSEHVELCFPPTSLALVLRHSMQLRDIVGDLQDDALGVHEDANEILACLLSDNFNAHWSLPPVEPLRAVSLSEPTLDEMPNESNEPNAGIFNPPTTMAQKRQFVQDVSETASKRLRLDESQDTTQFTESSKAATQTLDSDLQTLEKNLIQMRGSHSAALEKLQKALAATQSHLQQREKILESLQHRYETRTKDLHKVRQERDRLLEARTTSEQRLEKQKEDLTKLKDERTQLRHELEQAREALKTGGGDMAELEKAREEIRRLTKENASLERKSEYEHKQAEYTREQYQTASNVAAQSSNELRQSKEENESLKRKVAGEATQLRELNMRNDESRHLSRVEELEALVSSREELLRKKEDELREIRKNRPSTRSTSTQPRSPKLNPGNSRPTSPGPNNGSSFLGRGSALRFSSEMSL
ncbi:class II histone deacetylase complex subunits 2 and 3-domain-containing protein [Aspergillus cavernicola]|uniref:Class II histone deacetylase complex subunits 2 and 3-domain-containing protein n=1 Tax=Aspergillus cavernicola TaxID=176166 RepID=A0ABR4IE12_9EURO